MDWLTDPWTSELMRRAFAEALLVGAACGALGSFVVVRGLAFLGEAVAHVLILGAVVALVLGGPVGVGAFAAAALAVWLASIVAADRRFSPDTAIGILLPSFFGLAVVLAALTDANRARLEDLLFGSILAVTGLDVLLAAGVALGAAALIAGAGKELALAAFDRAMARSMGYRVRVLDLLLFTAVALAAIVALRAVGNVLVAALLLGPPLVARQLTRSFGAMCAVSAAVGAVAGVAGLYWSWHENVGAGAAIVLVIAGLYGIVALASLARRARPAAAATAVIAAALLLAACGGDEAGDGGKPRVVATTMQLQDIARQVGGDDVEVHGILGHDAEPHEYEPKPSDAEAVAGADVVIANGGGLDDWLGDLLDSAGGDARRVTVLDELPEGIGADRDPHVWHDPGWAREYVDAVEVALAEATPGALSRIRARADRLRDEIEATERRIRALLDPIPRERRKLVTSHDAFGWFARAYGIEVVGSVLPSVTTDTEPSGEQVRELVEDIRAAKVDTIFTEEAVDAKLERQVADEAGARVSTSLYADVLGEPGTPEGTLTGAELHNAKAMAEAWK